MQTKDNTAAALDRALRSASLYRLYARCAEDEDYMQIADLFRRTADNELEHAALLWELAAQCTPPSTAKNLAAAFDAEQNNAYAAYAETAEREGLPETAYLFRQLAGVEQNHARRFRILGENIRADTVFQKPQDSYWVCRVCGALHHARTAPKLCPVCGYGQGCFSLYAEDF